MNETQQKGLITEMQVQLACIKNGINVYIPLASDSRCDLIIEINKKLYKIQIKTSKVTESNTGICFNTCSNRMNHSEGNIRQKYDKEDVDFFATFYNNNVYLVPIELCQGTKRTLLFENKQRNGTMVYFIEDYELNKMINNLKNNTNILSEVNNGFVIQIDMETNKEIKRYGTYSEASRAIGKKDAGVGHISQAARGMRKSAYGFYWKLVTE